jgi:rfaE bifunctional protein nucleotidyltransferase chain/domain
MGQIVQDWKLLSTALESFRTPGKKIVSTNGVFDILHVGHARYLQAARKLGDCLVVGVNSDACTRRLKGPGRPYVPEAERMELVAALGCVDFVTIFDEPTPEALLDVIRPSIHAKGGDYHLALLPETAVVQSHGGQVVTVPFEEGFSTTSLSERIAAAIAQRGLGWRRKHRP